MDRGLRQPTQIPPDQAGFTLIELMIVVAVLAILSVTVSLSASRPQSAMASDAARFEALHDRLRSEAILSRQILGLAVDAEGYQRLRWQGGDWQRVGEKGRWRGPVTVLLPFDRRAPLEFTPGGQVTPLRLRFETAAGVRLCETGGWAAVTCRAG